MISFVKLFTYMPKDSTCSFHNGQAELTSVMIIFALSIKSVVIVYRATSTLRSCEHNDALSPISRRGVRR